MRIHLLPLAVIGGALAGATHAAPYAPFDVRAAGMGGTGVASAKAASAALFNPAMLSAQVEGDRFQLVLGLGATVADEDNMFDQVDTLQTTFNGIHSRINTWFPADGPANLTINVGVPYLPASTEYQALTEISSATTALVTQLNTINNDNLIAGLGTGLGFGVPGKTVGVGVFVSGTGNVVASPQIAAADTNLLSRYADALADGSVSAMEAAQHTDIFSNVNAGTVTVQDINPQSSVNGLVVALVEYGVGFSHNFELASGGQLSVGVTPKIVNVVSFDYTANVEYFEDSDIDTQEKTEDSFDADLGLVYKANLDSAWQYAVVAKHVIGGDFTTSPNLAGGQLPKTIEIAPQIRAGIARMTKRTTMAFDLDLVQNDGIMAGSESQFLAFGAEYDLSFLQLRAGYRANLASSDVSDVATVGLGLGPIDISAVASDTTLGAYLQFGFGW